MAEVSCDPNRKDEGVEIAFPLELHPGAPGISYLVVQNLPHQTPKISDSSKFMNG